MLSLAFVPVHAQTSPTDSKLAGAWVATQAQSDGSPASDLIGHRLTFTGERFDIRSRDGKTVYAGTYSADAAAKPTAIDFVQTQGELKGKTWKGIYKLEGDSVTICDNAVDMSKPRPTAFEAAKGSGYVCLTFARAR